MVDSKRYQDWLNYAKQDIRAAKILKDHDCGWNLVAFQCQQAVEKALKAFILYKSGEIPTSHSLLYLNKLAANYLPELSKFLKDSSFLNQFYIETRYPPENPLLLSEEIGLECLRIAEEIVTHLEIILTKTEAENV
ncbi:HEPN protein [Carboxydothermus islandicus]|uniref:HEPN protein n=1 Tax=Carboxydothermus islandicus TaxID=661089 RepID=A0A1L8D1R5_9THEO|nr:HEPN domain-containing protein [Carboxydothermus islandicus]GAV25135.1 HEPN protein [Carboxydothermus islandicus]